ncbi:MAG: putative Ig domain-containing protein [Patescibacteria group bacterium]|nr:putative Ig domain-containing protein [Patescibacteria group bacterium]MDD5554480.1 putative Ig domain-containing protein [Patescibacteria group bacterium]
MRFFNFLKNKLKISGVLTILLGIVVFSFFALGFLKDTKYSYVLAQTGKTNSPDAIAIRVIPNPDHLSISRWYSEQGFKGSPQGLTVDGYEALRDGRTVYVNAANVVGNGLYTNIYLISYNQEAEAATKNILDQIIAHWKFNTNIEDSEQKVLIARDAKRLASLAEIKMAVENYKEEMGYYPKLSAGTYLPGKTISTWPSWQQTLAKELGTGLPTDPINKLGACPGYDSSTCWKEADKSFADPTPVDSEFNLPTGSNAFVYTAAADGSSYNVCAVMESGLITTLDAGACAGSEAVKHGGTTENNPPTIICNNLVGNPNKPFKGYISASDLDGDPLTWSIDTAGAAWLNSTLGGATNQKEISATAAGAQGTYSFTVTVDDNKEDGRVTKTCSISIIGSALPVVTPIADKEIIIGRTLDFTIYATDPTGNSFSSFNFNPALISCTIINGHDCRVQSVIGNTFSLTKDGGDNMYENYSISASATNSQGVSSLSQLFNLKVINHKPVVSIPASCSTKVRINNDYTPCLITASDPDGHSISSFSFSYSIGSFSSSGLPNGMAGNTSTGEISGKPDTAGNYTIAITAADQYGAISSPKNLTLKVNTYCGDGVWQATNGEGLAEKCDTIDNIAANPAGSSINKQYACDSSCQFTGGYCGDEKIQDSKGEVCDKTAGIASSPSDSSSTKQYGCTATCTMTGGYCGDSIKNGPEVCDKNVPAQACTSTYAEGFPAHCTGMEISGTQTCNSNCGGWSSCVIPAPDVVGNSSTACNTTNPTMNDYACCELTSCGKDGCDCCGRKCGAETPSGYNLVQWLDPCATRTTKTSGCTTSDSDYSCKLSQSTSDLRNWIITTNHTTANFRCWK